MGLLYLSGKGHYCRIVFGRQLEFLYAFGDQFNISAKQDCTPLFVKLLCCRFPQCTAVLLSLCRKCVLKVEGMCNTRSKNFAVSRDGAHRVLVLVLSLHVFTVVMYWVIKLWNYSVWGLDENVRLCFRIPRRRETTWPWRHLRSLAQGKGHALTLLLLAVLHNCY